MRTPADPDWYAILGVDPSASDAEIGRAFRSLARRFHPDVGGEASDRRFSDVAQAYEVLGRRSRRAEYDRVRSGVPAGGIRIPVRRWAAAPERAPSVDPTAEGPDAEQAEVVLSVSFAEAIGGTMARVGLPGGAVCGDCSGSGRRSGGTCNSCGGQGRRQRLSGSITINHICRECDGSGARPPVTCSACGGRGWTERYREVSVRVPPGVAEGTRLRLRAPTGEAIGFARVRIRPDPWFSRDGRDLVLRLPVNLAEAALGAAVTALLPDGPAEICVPPGAQPGTRLRLAGRGLPGPERGDLVAVVEVAVPDDPGVQERAALEALRAVSPNPRNGWPSAPPTSEPAGKPRAADDQSATAATAAHRSTDEGSDPHLCG